MPSKGSIVAHIKSARRMFVESTERRIVYCAWLDTDGVLRRGAYGVDWLAPHGMALA